ncbi:NAD-dependent alcohol dehydrogenase [Cyphellophora attinorum]|uniref:NAD-dependent alcohol dehydrogenase n=1 Tax=Cyphellophora attinorum TaxID=1664694 RepID=A0A0N1HSW2_9EURO|nr:NAD-dependent alcohol dehydrogenase [Phialophora attinorum]KPI41843.1 NAD-dependent alcohol dehydrogenase [Phialophora attinorum]
MEAWAVVEHGKPLEKITRAIPEPSGQEIVVEVTHCGVCHSDLHFWEGFYDLGGGKIFRIGDRGVKLPRAIGHEIAGKVLKVGPDLQDQDIRVGDTKLVYPWLGCGHCRRCAQGQDNLCGKQKSLGVLQDGGFASHVVVPESKYLLDPGQLDLAVACTYSCSGITAFSAISKVMPLEAEDWIVLIGAGGVGLSAVAMLKGLGHKAILSVDIFPEREAAVLEAGAKKYVCGSGPELSQQILEATGGPVLGVIDFVNNSQTAQTGYSLLDKGGRMVQVGVMGGELNLSLVGNIFKAATVMGNNTGNLEHFHRVLELAKQGKLLPVPVEPVPWDKADEAIQRLRAGKLHGRLVLVK